MIRPFTCLSLAAALGAGLYLYQEKHRVQLLDREIARTVHQADQTRDRIGLMRAEWALLNEPERLAGLAAAHLQLQTLAPAQYARLEDLRSRLPAVAPAQTAPADMPPVAATRAPVLALAAPAAMPPPAALAAMPPPAALAAMPPPAALTAMPPPAAPAAVRPPAPQAVPAMATPVTPVTAAPPAAAPAPARPPVVAAAPPRPAAPRVAVAAKPREPDAPPAAPRPLFAPVMPAYAPAPMVIHAPSVQTASAVTPPSPYVGSSLGMARTNLPAPVPVGSVSVASFGTPATLAAR